MALSLAISSRPLQLPKLSELLDQADGILPESTNAGAADLLYLSDYHAEALDLLRKGLADEPYLAAWLAAAESASLRCASKSFRRSLCSRNAAWKTGLRGCVVKTITCAKSMNRCCNR